jgi:formylglycine-generating enzyme required for sulfatase activity
MSGNVWEWCLNEYDNPVNTATDGGARRVLRGGAWSPSQNLARAVYRYMYSPNNWFDGLGFRVVCSVPMP